MESPRGQVICRSCVRDRTLANKLSRGYKTGSAPKIVEPVLTPAPLEQAKTNAVVETPTETRKASPFWYDRLFNAAVRSSVSVCVERLFKLGPLNGANGGYARRTNDEDAIVSFRQNEDGSWTAEGLYGFAGEYRQYDANGYPKGGAEVRVVPLG